MYTNLSDDENFVLTHISMFGSAAYPVRKMSGKWFVEPIRGCGACPIAFKTKREATTQFELYCASLRDRAAGRV